MTAKTVKIGSTNSTPKTNIEQGMARFRLNVAYDGTDYVGWQIQPNGVTIQAKLEEAFTAITGEAVRIHGSGRTDAGVHARAQVLHFDSPWPAERAERDLVKALNAKLPNDIRVWDLRVVADDFHAQYHTTGKEYRYFIWNGRVVPPFLYRYRTRVPESLNLDAMRTAAAFLLGTHDFSSFAAYPNEERENNVRTIHSFEVSSEGEELCLQVAGNGFLYKMVRSLSGWLLDVGRGKFEPGRTATVLAAAERTGDVVTAPAKGLFLWQVDYPETEHR